MGNVPCNGCTLCCKGPIALHPALGDDCSKYDVTVRHDEVPGVWIKVQDNGDCIYRGVAGCNIWNDRPALCRAFDCREYIRIADKYPVVDPDVIARGKELGAA